MSATTLLAPPSQPELVAELASYPNVDAWSSDNRPAEACELDFAHGPALVFLTIHGDTCRRYAVCGPCAVGLVAPLPATEMVDAECYEAPAGAAVAA